MPKRFRLVLILAALSLLAACGQPDTGTALPAASAPTDLNYGGRLFDSWYKEIDSGFVPDDETTPEPDGRGGPNGDGTLNDEHGNPILNSGHAYRFKNLLGWDLLGNEGIYGAAYQAKEFVLPQGPASVSESRAVWIQRVANGAGSLPAYRDVLSNSQIEVLVDFMLAVSAGEIPGRGDVWELSTTAPKGFVLVPGGDANRGHALYAERCADCHGADAATIMFDNGEQTLGMHARYYGYAIAQIVLAGEPGSDMEPEFTELEFDARVQALKDLLAALCDRDRYIRGTATDPDVPDGDPRCGVNLR